jgi:hypothetical protein
MSAITDILDRYGEKKAALAAVEVAIESAASALVAQRKELEAAIKELDKEAKSKAKYIPESQAHTLLGRLFQMVWSNPEPKLDESKVSAMVEQYNGLLKLVRQLPGQDGQDLGNEFRLVSLEDMKTAPGGYWAIHKRGKGS